MVSNSNQSRTASGSAPAGRRDASGATVARRRRQDRRRRANSPSAVIARRLPAANDAASSPRPRSTAEVAIRSSLPAIFGDAQVATRADQQRLHGPIPAVCAPNPRPFLAVAHPPPLPRCAAPSRAATILITGP